MAATATGTYFSLFLSFWSFFDLHIYKWLVNFLATCVFHNTIRFLINLAIRKIKKINMFLLKKTLEWNLTFGQLKLSRAIDELL